MSYTILHLARRLARTLGLRVPDTIATTTDRTLAHLRQQIIEAGDTLALAYEWGDLVKSTTIAAVAATPSYNLPADFLRLSPGAAVTVNGEPLTGGLSDSEFEMMRSAPFEAWKHVSYRVLGNRIEFAPTPVQSATVRLSYVSEFWIKTTAGVGVAEPTSDNDEILIPYRPMLYQSMDYWRLSKGLSRERSQRMLAQAVPLDAVANRADANNG